MFEWNELRVLEYSLKEHVQCMLHVQLAGLDFQNLACTFLDFPVACLPKARDLLVPFFHATSPAISGPTLRLVSHSAQ